MASYTFNCADRIIQMTSTGTLDMQDLYSRWKDAIIAETIKGCKQALRVVKEVYIGGQFIGPYYFMMNDWQIRPVDSDQELVVSGVVVQDTTSAESPFKVDDLTNRVQIVREVSAIVLTQETGISGLTAAESAKLDVIEDTKDAMLGNSEYDPNSQILTVKREDETTLAQYQITQTSGITTKKEKI